MSDIHVYDSFGDELREVPSEPVIAQHNQVLAMIARRSAKRLAECDSRQFRKELARLSGDANQLLSDMVRAEEEGSGDRAKYGPKLSEALMQIQDLSSSGLADIDAEIEFMDVVEKVLKRGEAFEALKSQRINALSAQAVGKMIENFTSILKKYLPTKQAQKAYAELLASFPRNADQDIMPTVISDSID